MDEYPVVAGGTGSERSGHTKGLLTIFDAAAADNGEIFRISVYGGGKEGYLA
jgi:hypothetical protein